MDPKYEDEDQEEGVSETDPEEDVDKDDAVEVIQVKDDPVEIVISSDDDDEVLVDVEVKYGHWNVENGESAITAELQAAGMHAYPTDEDTEGIPSVFETGGPSNPQAGVTPDATAGDTTFTLEERIQMIRAHLEHVEGRVEAESLEVRDDIEWLNSGQETSNVMISTLQCSVSLIEPRLGKVEQDVSIAIQRLISWESRVRIAANTLHNLFPPSHH